MPADRAERRAGLRCHDLIPEQPFDIEEVPTGRRGRFSGDSHFICVWSSKAPNRLTIMLREGGPLTSSGTSVSQV